MYSESDVQPEFTVEEVESLLFVRKGLADLTEADKANLLRKINSIGLAELRRDTVILLLCILHEAREVDQPRFLQEVFLPWQRLREKTKPHFERVADELSRIGAFEAGSVQEAVHAANVYRSIVADLFDPYLTLAVACIQFKEGTFTDIQGADLSLGEFGKYEYLLKRVKALTRTEPHLLATMPACETPCPTQDRTE